MNSFEKHKYKTNANGHRLIVRNDYLPARDLQSGIGNINIKQPRVRDKSKNIKFAWAILPRYMKKCPSLENLIPILYLKGISTRNFQQAL